MDRHKSFWEGLRPLGGPPTLPRSQRKLGWGDEEFSITANELCDAGLAEWQGKRLARVVTGAGVSPEAEMLLAALPGDGSSIGGLRLRSMLDLDNETYTRARNELHSAGLIVRGRGKGGTVARAAAKSASSAASRARLVPKESDLYDPFLEWRRAELDGQPGFAHAKRTASAKGWSHGSGKWSRPDVTAVQVITYEWLPRGERRGSQLRGQEVLRRAEARKRV